MKVNGDPPSTSVDKTNALFVSSASATLVSIFEASIFQLYAQIHLDYGWNYVHWERMSTFRSSHGRCSVKQGVLKNLANFAAKQLHWSLFLTLLKRESNTGVFL